jgi:hypothetical protein
MKKFIVTSMALLSVSLFTPASAADPGGYVLVDLGVLTYTGASGFSNPGNVKITGSVLTFQHFHIAKNWVRFGMIVID